MIALLLGSLLAGPVPVAPAQAPSSVIVATPRGEERVAVRPDRSGAPVLPAAPLVAALAGTIRISGAWAEVTIAQRPLRFLVGASFYQLNDRAQPLAGAVSLSRDTLFLPLQVVTEVLPRVFGERYRWDAAEQRLIEAGWRPGAVPLAPEPVAGRPGRAPASTAGRLPSGLLPGHAVTIDPGHGGVDPGNPGLFFPRGTREKDVALQFGLLLRDELRRRGIAVRMTRTTDTLIALGDRGSFCSEECDLFVSLHVNSLPKRPGYTAARGFETYFLAEARTEDARRVARMENEAVRFETDEASGPALGGLDFILKDLQLNEHLRESARAAELVQQNLDTVHDGTNRGVKQAGFMVLTTARRPAILVELGYSTNPEDGRLLTTRAKQRTLTTALADAVVAYLLEYERKTAAGTEAGR